MTIYHPTIPATVTIAMALALSACGKQEAVGDVPSSEQLAKEADAATAAIRQEAADAENNDQAKNAPAEALKLTMYNNALRGYSIMVPESWKADETAGDDNGQLFTGGEKAGSLSVIWTENRDDADYKKAIAAVEKTDDKLTGEQVSPDEYRIVSADGTDRKTLAKILRKEDGSMVRATIDYPGEASPQLDAIANQMIDSLALK